MDYEDDDSYDNTDDDTEDTQQAAWTPQSDDGADESEQPEPVAARAPQPVSPDMATWDFPATVTPDEQETAQHPPDDWERYIPPEQPEQPDASLKPPPDWEPWVDPTQKSRRCRRRRSATIRLAALSTRRPASWFYRTYYRRLEGWLWLRTGRHVAGDHGEVPVIENYCAVRSRG
jgi:hypothetical protein